MDNQTFKEKFTEKLFFTTVAWAVFCAILTGIAIIWENTSNILVAAGADTLLGALVSWNVITIQYWFRKKPNDPDVVPTVTPTPVPTIPTVEPPK